ncbi:MAG TPA: hypothetical protein K8V35_05590 [Aliicoccus persicus]|uniref:ChrR Cupin-like domain-containing protein n=1 Tax=Aliicoccus persicus TaxID=930138 RepID=A0A921DX69_9STAP|nr:hypothetical protein [Aliicoccus persicus]
MSRPEIEFTSYKDFPKVEIPNSTKGRTQRVISGEPGKGDFMRIAEFEPGVDTSAEGVQSHDYWEELYIIEGSVIDLTLDQEFTAGMVASRPPGMPHGPWYSPNGCVMLEIVYYKK